MRILVACEESQRVALAFRLRGFDAYSCDLLPCSGGYPQWHIQDDVRKLLNGGGVEWDMIIAHPPCDHLAVSGARWFKEKQADGRQQAGIAFFMMFTGLKCKHVAIENPIGIMSTIYRKPDQIIQPYEFGHTEQKATCLWLIGLPQLKPTDNVYDQMMLLPRKYREKVHFLPNTPSRSLLRSKTYEGIAEAMANQWGDFLLQKGI